MGLTMPPITVLVGILCAGLGLLLDAVGVATTSWIVVDVATSLGSVSLGFGLWNYCTDIISCPDFMLVCRAMGILGVALLGMCSLFGIVTCFRERDQANFSLLAAMTGFAAAGSSLIEVSVFAAKSPWTSYGYSFYLTIVAFVLAVVAGLFFLLGKMRAR